MTQRSLPAACYCTFWDITATAGVEMTEKQKNYTILLPQWVTNVATFWTEILLRKFYPPPTTVHWDLYTVIFIKNGCTVKHLSSCVPAGLEINLDLLTHATQTAFIFYLYHNLARCPLISTLCFDDSNRNVSQWVSASSVNGTKNRHYYITVGRYYPA